VQKKRVVKSSSYKTDFQDKNLILRKENQKMGKIEDRCERMPKQYRNCYLKAVKRAKKINYKNAIKAFCLECMGWHFLEVKKCKCDECPLFLAKQEVFKIIA